MDTTQLRTRQPHAGFCRPRFLDLNSRLVDLGAEERQREGILAHSSVPRLEYLCQLPKWKPLVAQCRQGLVLQPHGKSREAEQVKKCCACQRLTS